jgi:hypothetical protein
MADFVPDDLLKDFITECDELVQQVEQYLLTPIEGLIGRESTVVKPLSALLRVSTYVAGATITGDRRVHLVLDPNNLIRGCSSPYAVH